MDAINTIIVAVLGTWFGAIGIAIVAVLWKLNTTVTRLNSNMDHVDERLDGHDERLDKHSNHIFGKAAKIVVLFALLMILPGCSLFGLDMEQAQADAEETASALEIVNKRVPAIEASIDNLVLLYDAAVEREDYDEAKRLALELQSEVKNLELTVEEKTQLTATFDKQVSAFKNAKDTRGYLQAALGLFGGVFATFFGGRGMLKRRDKIIRTTASNYDEADGDVTTLKMLQRERLDQTERDLLSKLRKG